MNDKQRVWNILKGSGMKYTAEEIQTMVWAVVVIGVLSLLVISTIGIILSVLFVDHDLTQMAPIDQKFLEILKEIMLVAIGVISGVASTKIGK
jgi:hypothetical protein